VDQVAIFFEMWLMGITTVLVMYALWPQISHIAILIIAGTVYLIYFLFKYYLIRKLRIDSETLFFLVAKFYLLSTLAKRLESNVSAAELYRVTIGSVSDKTGSKIQIAIAEIIHNYSKHEKFVLSAVAALFNEEKKNYSFLFEDRQQYSLLAYYLRQGILGEEFSYDVHRGFNEFMTVLGETLYLKVIIARKDAASRMHISPGQAIPPDGEYQKQIGRLLINPYWEANEIEIYVKNAALRKNNHRVAKGGVSAPIYGAV
jgi:hypothetical protein